MPNPKYYSLIHPSRYLNSVMLACAMPEVTCLSLNNLLPNVFVAGHTGSILAMYSLDASWPLWCWEGSSLGPTSHVYFIPNRVSVFLALFPTSGTLCCFDVLQSGDALRHRSSIKKEGAFPVAISICGYQTESAILVVAYSDGSVQVHKLEDSLVKESANEVDDFRSRYLLGAAG